MLLRQQIGTGLIIVIGVSLMAFLILQDAIPQDSTYHQFSDMRSLWGIPNAGNLLSNLPFLWVGVLGLYKLYTRQLNIEPHNQLGYVLLFTGVALVALGSGYYHLWPSNATLLWDRLPMTIAFMALYSVVITEFMSVKAGKRVLLPLVLLGVLSALYWHFTEAKGQGDLRLYILVQFFPLLTIPIILLTFPARFTHKSAYWWLISAYFIAKVLEHFDAQIHSLLVIISGHSLKHIAAAIGLYVLLRGYQQRHLT